MALKSAPWFAVRSALPWLSLGCLSFWCAVVFCFSFVGFAIFSFVKLSLQSLAAIVVVGSSNKWARFFGGFAKTLSTTGVSALFQRRSVFVGSDMEQTEMVAPELSARSPCYLLVCACCLQFIHLPHFLLAHVPRFGDWSGVLTFSAPPRCSRRHRTAGRIVCFRGVGTRIVQQRFRRTAPCHQHDLQPCVFFS